MKAAVAVALATFFVAVQFYTSLDALSPTPPVGFSFATRPLALALVGALALAGVACVAWLARERALVGRSAAHALVGAWLAAVVVSSALGLDPAIGLAVLGLLALASAFALALVRAFDVVVPARAILVPYLAVGALAAASGVAMDVARRPAQLWALNNGRAAGVFITANQFAAFAVAFAFVALGTALATGGALRRLAVVATVAGTVALIGTVSIAATLGAAVAAVFYALALGARRGALVVSFATVIAGGALGIVPAARHDPADRFDRLRTWTAGARLVELFPLTGSGPMTYWRVYPAIRPTDGDPPGTFGALHPHDAYLSLAGELGLVGLAAVAYGVVRFVRGVRIGLRERTYAERRFVLGVCAALVAVAVQGVFDTIGVVQMCFVWLPYGALALAAATHGMREATG